MIVIRSVLTLRDHTTAVVIQDLYWQQITEHAQVTAAIIHVLLILPIHNEVATCILVEVQ